MEPNGLFNLYVWCSNKNAHDNCDFYSKLPFTVNISSKIYAEIAVLELTLPGRWFNVPQMASFYIFDVTDNTKQVFVSLPSGYYQDYKKIAQRINAQMDLSENKLDEKKLSTLCSFKMDTKGDAFVALGSGYGIYMLPEFQKMVNINLSRYVNKTDRDIRVYFREIDLFRNQYAIMLECASVKPSVVDNSTKKILRIIPGRKNIAENEMYIDRFDPIYMQLTFNRLDEIKASLVDYEGRKLVLPKGDAVCLLHIRFKSS